jgi:hypothetical protein
LRERDGEGPDLTAAGRRRLDETAAVGVSLLQLLRSALLRDRLAAAPVARGGASGSPGKPSARLPNECHGVRRADVEGTLAEVTWAPMHIIERHLGMFKVIVCIVLPLALFLGLLALSS